jgi:BMFP domain-containing protein YqiC
MDDTKKMLWAIINGQSATKSELIGEIQKVDKKLSLDIGSLRKETKEGFKKLTVRVDKIGLQVARLEDDTPTREEHDKLEERVGKLEQKIVTV